MLGWIVWQAYALNSDYNPFSDSEMEQIHASALKNDKQPTIRCITKLTEENVCRFTIYRGDKLLYAEVFDLWFRYSDTYIADLDNNGLEDVVKPHYRSTEKLDDGCELLIFSQYEPGKFARFDMPVERFSPKNVFDMDGDGHREILSCALVEYDQHNYWLYHVWHLEGDRLVCVDAKWDFPRAIRYTQGPNQRPASQSDLAQIVVRAPSIAVTPGKPGTIYKSQGF